MNRPNKEDYNIYEEEGSSIVTGFATNEYIEDLEKYCDELEKALDKACEELYIRDKNHAPEEVSWLSPLRTKKNSGKSGR